MTKANTLKKQARRRSLTPSDVVVGKDVLELVSSAMYVDPMTIYREYVQNAADAVDVARDQGLLKKRARGTVKIRFDHIARRVFIRDDGSGLEPSVFAHRLMSLGSSPKRGTFARGFRGVGRLAGLGYAKELTFRSRTTKDDAVLELRWDCLKLRRHLRSSTDQCGLTDLIRDVVTIDEVAGDDKPARFFEVELNGVVRLGSDDLMSPEAVARYLSEVGPIPFAPNFSFHGDIQDALEVAGHNGADHLGALNIEVEGIDGSITRPHRNRFDADQKTVFVGREVEPIKISGLDGGVAAVGWVLHHDYEGAIPTHLGVKGLRLRCGNIQVGDSALLRDYFPEARFNGWSVGEIHILDPRITPNARRDHFEQNAHFLNLVNHIAPLTRDISRQCRTNSVRRRWTREFESRRDVLSHTIAILIQGALSKAEQRRLIAQAAQMLDQLRKQSARDLFPLQDGVIPLDVIQSFEEAIEDLRNDEVSADPLELLPKSKQKVYRGVFDLIYQCSTNRVAAKALVDRMLEQIVADTEAREREK